MQEQTLAEAISHHLALKRRNAFRHGEARSAPQAPREERVVDWLREDDAETWLTPREIDWGK